MRDIYGDGCDTDEPTVPEVVNMDSIERYAGGDARWANALLIRDFDWHILWYLEVYSSKISTNSAFRTKCSPLNSTYKQQLQNREWGEKTGSGINIDGRDRGGRK